MLGCFGSKNKKKQHTIKECKRLWLKHVKNPQEISQKLHEKKLLSEWQNSRIQRKSSTVEQNEVLFQFLSHFESPELQVLCGILIEFKEEGLEAVAEKIADIIRMPLSRQQWSNKSTNDLSYVSQPVQEGPAAAEGGELPTGLSHSQLQNYFITR